MRTVLRVPRVLFELKAEFDPVGTLSLLEHPEGYALQWEAESSIDPDYLLEHNVPKTIVLPFVNIQHIAKRELSLTRHRLHLKSTEDSYLPSFVFTHYSSIFITHLIEFLLFKNVITPPNSGSHIYVVNFPTKQDENTSPVYVPVQSMSSRQLALVAYHNRILKKLNFKSVIEAMPPVSLTEAKQFVKSNYIADLKQEVYSRGLTEEARPYVYSYILGFLTPEQDASVQMQQKLEIYKKIKQQWSLFRPEQFNNCERLLDIQQVIEKDVRRNDRNTVHFQSDDNPNLKLLTNVLIVYALYNRDCGYVQGMNDLVSPLIVLYIKSWNSEGITLYDDSVYSLEEAESFIFWHFVQLMAVTHQDRLFSDVATNQAFVLERVQTIASAIHTPLRNILEQHNLDAMFLFRPLLLLYKRDFNQTDLFRLWDSILCFKSPYIFVRYVSAAVLILLFPRILVSTDGTLGEVMNATDGFLERANILSIISLASILDERIKYHPREAFVKQEIIENRMFIDYKPKFMEFN